MPAEGPSQDVEGTIVIAGHLETMTEQPEADGRLTIEVRGLSKLAEQRLGVVGSQGVAEGITPGVGVGDAGDGEQAAGSRSPAGITRSRKGAADDGPGVEGSGRGDRDRSGPSGQPSADRRRFEGRRHHVQPGGPECLDEGGVSLVVGDHPTADLLEPVDQVAVDRGRPRAALDLVFQGLDPRTDDRRRPRGGLLVMQSLQRDTRRLPPGEVAIGIGRRLVAEQLGFLQGEVDLGEPGLTLIHDRGHPAASADDQRHDGGGEGHRQPTMTTVHIGAGLRLDPGELGGVQPILHADPVGADPPRHNLGVARPVGHLGGHTFPGQFDQLRIGPADGKSFLCPADLAPRGPLLDLHRVWTHECRRARQDLAEDRPQGEDVGPLIQRIDLAAGLLRRHVRRGPHYASREREFAVIPAPCGGYRLLVRLAADHQPFLVSGRVLRAQDLGQTPVHHLHLSEATDHDVRRLQVAMDHAPRMRVGHRLADRFEDLQEPGMIVGRLVAVGEHFGQSAAPDQLHREVGPSIGEGPQLVDRDDPRMLELSADLRLLDEPTDHVGLVAVLLTQHFDGQVAPQIGIMPLEDHSHPAAADHAEELQPPGAIRIARRGQLVMAWGGRRKRPGFRVAPVEVHLRHSAQCLAQGVQDARGLRAERDQEVVSIRPALLDGHAPPAGPQQTDRAELPRRIDGPRLPASTAALRFIHRRIPPHNRLRCDSSTVTIIETPLR